MATSVSQLRYDRLMAHARLRGRPAGYVERHHVVPRSAGGGDAGDNLVWLTAREHFLAHWLLYRALRTPAAARAFKLMVHDQGRRRGRDYATARSLMSASMQGDANVSRRPEVRAKLRANGNPPFLGKKRPEHAALMRSKGLFSGSNNPGYGAGARQRGEKNHMATRVVGAHKDGRTRVWATMTSAATELGVTLQAVAQAMRKKQCSKGWTFERAL